MSIILAVVFIGILGVVFITMVGVFKHFEDIITGAESSEPTDESIDPVHFGTGFSSPKVYDKKGFQW